MCLSLPSESECWAAEKTQRNIMSYTLQKTPEKPIKQTKPLPSSHQYLLLLIPHFSEITYFSYLGFTSAGISFLTFKSFLLFCFT